MEKNQIAEEIAKRIRESEEYFLPDCVKLCRLAGLSTDWQATDWEAWEASDDETFESLLREAAKILAVDIGI